LTGSYLWCRGICCLYLQGRRWRGKVAPKCWWYCHTRL